MDRMGSFVTDREARALKESLLPFDPDLKLRKGIEETEDKILVNYFPTKEELSEEMRCSVCNEMAEPPAYLCYSGHWICGKDMRHTDLCPFENGEQKCQKDFHPIRPLFYECIYNYVNDASSMAQPKTEKGPTQSVKHNRSSSPALFDPDLKLQKGIGTRLGIDPFLGKISHFDGDLSPVMMTKKREDKILVNYFPTKEELSEEMRCSVCNEMAEPPAYLCYSGHWICGKDLKHTARCPFGSGEQKCQKDFHPIRPLFYECIYNDIKVIRAMVQPKIEKGNAIQILKQKLFLNDQLIKVLTAESEKKKLFMKDVPKSRPMFPKYRFDKNDINFITKNAKEMETIHLKIPSVKRMGIPKDVVNRELCRFQRVVEDSILIKMDREAVNE